MSVVARAIVIALSLSLSGSVALADTPTASPHPATPPSPSPSPSPAVPRATASPAPTPSASASAASVPEVTPEEAREAEAERAALAAVTLADRISAMRRYAETELGFVRSRLETVREDQAHLRAEEEDTTQRVAERTAQLEAILVDAYRESRVSPLEALVGRRSIADALVHVGQLQRLGQEERAMVEDLRGLQARQHAEAERIDGLAAQLDALDETLAAKNVLLTELDARASILAAAADAGDAARVEAERTVLAQLADEQARSDAAADAIVARLAAQAGVDLHAPATWVWPVAGAIAQPFGPTALGLEPPFDLGGVHYAHFHTGIDLAAPLHAPVRAAADGRVSYVGHLPDGAMVVMIVHGDGVVSLYGHLDDGAWAPTVHVGDAVHAGDVVGAIGLTGLTTGPHLHFALYRGATPFDPRSLLTDAP